jgi:hypothetical protein
VLVGQLDDQVDDRVVVDEPSGVRDGHHGGRHGHRDHGRDVDAGVERADGTLEPAEVLRASTAVNEPMMPSSRIVLAMSPSPSSC